MLAGRIKRARKCRDCARAAQADVIPTVRAEIPTTWVQAFDLARVADDGAIGVQRQHSILAAVEVQQPLISIDDQASRIGDAWIIAEHPQRRTLATERKQRAKPIAIDTGRACNKEWH